MNHPYRTNPIDKKEWKKKCWFLHDWILMLKPEAETRIIKSKKIIKNKTIYFFNPFEDYQLLCETCGKQKNIGSDGYYINLVIQDMKNKFKKDDLNVGFLGIENLDLEPLAEWALKNNENHIQDTLIGLTKDYDHPFYPYTDIDIK